MALENRLESIPGQDTHPSQVTDLRDRCDIYIPNRVKTAGLHEVLPGYTGLHIDTNRFASHTVAVLTQVGDRIWAYNDILQI